MSVCRKWILSKKNESLRIAGEYLTEENIELQKKKNSNLTKEVRTLNTEISSLKRPYKGFEDKHKGFI
ncbi:hypothetical protein GCM10020331_091480 [Ectobacillus funiculus]